MGQSREEALSAIRFSLGASNTLDEVDRVLDVVPPLVERLRRR